jgi:O-antigen ligase
MNEVAGAGRATDLQPRGGLAGALGMLAMALLGIGLPVAMVLANKSAPVALVAATLVALGAIFADGVFPAFWQRHLVLLRSPIAVAAMVFAGLAVASLIWSIDRPVTLRSAIESVLMAYVGLVAATAMPFLATRSSGWLLVAGLLLAAALATSEAAGGMVVHGWLGERLALFDLKRSCVVLTLLALPAFGFLRQRGKPALAIVVALVALVPAVLAWAGTATLGLVTGMVVFALARLASRAMFVAVAIVWFALLASAPFAGSLATTLLSPKLESLLPHSHPVERMAIWSAFEARYRDHPWLGHGFNTSEAVSTHPRPVGVAPDADADRTIGKIHPHHSYLQIWVELGAVGALAAAAVFGFILRGMALAPSGGQALRSALLASAMLMALVGFGLWQAWWSAALASTMIWLSVAGRTATVEEINRV